MGVFHFAARLVDEAAGLWRFRYFPDQTMAKEVWGVFTVDPRDWSWCNEVPADAERKGLVASDEQCIAALVGKLRSRHAASPPPATVQWIA